MSPFEMVVVQLRKWDRKGYLQSRPRPDLQALSSGIQLNRVEIDTRLGETCTFDLNGMRVHCGGVTKAAVEYADVSGADWMSKNPQEAVRMKSTPDFDRLIIERFDGASFAINGLGQAVFPLFQAFRYIARRNKESRADQTVHLAPR
jgi:hypothetical protein